MNDRQDPYASRDPYAQDPYEGAQGRQNASGYAYDAYGQPVYQETPSQYDPYGAPYGHPQGQGYDPQYDQAQGYGQGAYEQEHGQGHSQGHGQGYDPYGGYQQPVQQAQQTQQQAWVPQQPQYGQQEYVRQQPYEAQTPYEPQPPYEQQTPSEGRPVYEAAPSGTPQDRPAGTGGRADGADRVAGEEYRTEQFSFIEEQDEESEDVIDWLRFTESRTERREEAKRRGRSRIIALTVVLALLAVGGVGYLWWAGKLPGLGGAATGDAATAAGQKRDVLLVHLRQTGSDESSTALLVENETTHKGTTVLLPNSLAITGDDGQATTLGKSVQDAGTEPTRDSLNTLLGADIKASWRLDTPYLENLVETVGGITVDADTTVPGAKKGDEPLVKAGKGRVLNGQAAVAYATYRGPGELQTKQLARFGQVMQATLKKMSSDADGATATVKSLMQVLDPPLTVGQLGSSLAQRAELAKTGAYRTTVLPVQQDGTLSARTASDVVKDVLGGKVKKTDPSATARVSVRNASGSQKAVGQAQATLVNGGYSFVDGGTAAGSLSASRVTYADEAYRPRAEEVAKTLGLPTSAVKKGKVASNADITVLLGSDYKG
ncbi:LCP family protein [Streptomyces olivaceiscleroticus]|uniref:Polydiglycosylphosphate transferase PdtA n=1 Tax=Streptomyces olivaceiscleroticus TaxID=68245 RepID=A0ABN1BJB2_9ACTN